MFEEQTKQHKLNVLFFYVRRMLRIWPLYYFTIFIGFFIYPLFLKLNGQVYTENASLLWYSIFAVNFDHIYHGNPSTGILGVQWSVAIEEQFYLLWPLVFYFFSKKNFYPFLLIIFILFSEFFFNSSTNGMIAHYHFLSNFRFLAFGGLLAYLCYCKREWTLNFFQKLNSRIHFIIYFACLFLILFEEKLSRVFYYYKYLNHLLPFLFFGFVIVEQCYSSNSFFKIGSLKVLNWLGKISYGLYLTHMIAIYIVLNTFPDNANYVLLKVLFSVIITIAISHFSYTYFESFFLSLKSKFSVIQTAYINSFKNGNRELQQTDKKKRSK
jgi:peptidoglycan/LPS O-acetylase OafA/YrhL